MTINNCLIFRRLLAVLMIRLGQEMPLMRDLSPEFFNGKVLNNVEKWALLQVPWLHRPMEILKDLYLQRIWN